MIVRARTTAGYQVFEGSPKSATSMRTIALDRHTIAWPRPGCPRFACTMRHGAATLAHLAGTDLKTISDQLGHSSIVLTADTYTSVLHPAQYKAAEATARLVLDAARHDRHKIAIVARRSRMTARKAQKVSPLTLATDHDHHSSPAISWTPKRSASVATARQPHDNNRPHRTR